MDGNSLCAEALDQTEQKEGALEKALGATEHREQSRHCSVSVSVSVMSKKASRTGVWQLFGTGRAGAGADRGFPPG